MSKRQLTSAGLYPKIDIQDIDKVAFEKLMEISHCKLRTFAERIRMIGMEEYSHSIENILDRTILTKIPL